MTHRLRQPTVIAMRMAVVLGFLLCMPILAIPAVLDTVDGLWTSAHTLAAGAIQSGLSNLADETEVAASRQTVAMIDLSQKGTSVVADQQDTRIRALAEGRLDVASGRQRSEPERVKLLPPVQAGQRMDEICRDLQRLGATRLHLERIGSHEQSYHFQCVMPVPDTGIYELPFSATDPDPVRAMERVLAKIEGWATAADRMTSVRTAPRR